MLATEPLTTLPYLVVDLETTGLNPDRDEIVEVAAVVVTPGQPPRLVLDTLIRPGGGVRGTQFHGITEDDVAQAPSWPQVLPLLRAAMANRVVVAHNADFDLGFIKRYVTGELGIEEVPHLCTLRLGSAIEGERRSLLDACRAAGISERPRHRAADDALMAADLLRQLLKQARRRGLRAWPDLQKTRGLERTALDRPPLPAPGHMATPKPGLLRPRVETRKRRPTRERDYLELVLDAAEDLHITDAELGQVRRAQDGLDWAAVRSIHARVFQGMLSRYTEDRRLDDREAQHIAALYKALERLGWAPGSSAA